MKTVFLFTLMFIAGAPFLSAQTDGWQNQDLHENGEFGISTAKAFMKLLSRIRRTPVIVAVIDSGLDTAHVDLQGHIWTNAGEIPGNGIDDDHNGYIDDLHGWNFAGLPISRDSLIDLLTRKKAFFDSLSYTEVPPQYQPAYRQFRQVWKDYQDIKEKLTRSLSDLKQAQASAARLVDQLGTSDPTLAQLKDLRRKDSSDRAFLDAVIAQMPAYPGFAALRKESIDNIAARLDFCVNHLVSGPDSAGIAGNCLQQNNNIAYDRIFAFSVADDFYHNQPLTFHGTHIAGIIAATGHHNKSVKGIADSVQIMPIKIYSAIYPKMLDANLSAAIRYAVDNGARVINLSLGLYTSPGKSDVDAAVRYAMEHNVLIVHAAGNDGKDLDALSAQGFFPNKRYADGRGFADAWLDVAASAWRDDSTLAAPFSNYGKISVDVFAPGTQIYSTIPGSRYGHFNGTSMATPVVAGLGALIMECYPGLTAAQVAEIIRQTAKKVHHPVLLPGQNVIRRQRPFNELSGSGGIVNAFDALLLAGQYNRGLSAQGQRR